MLVCPECGSTQYFKDGLRYLSDGNAVQRYLCRQCGYRFSEHLKSIHETVPHNQLCAILEEAKKLENTTETKTVVGESSQKSKILEHAWWLKKNGRSDSTIEGRVKILKTLVNRGADLYDPETVKDVIAKQTWSNGRKNNASDAYSAYLKMVGGTWEAPQYKKIRKLPFIPKETEIDQLIAGSSPRMAVFLQLLKETGARCGEIWQLKWEDIDFESKVINITPEKNSNPRVIHLSNKVLEMLEHLPRKYGLRVFSLPTMRLDNFAVNFQRQRRRTTNKIQNPRLLKIHFHTFRYWRGTMLYHNTRSEYYVMQQLGHKNIANTLLYIQLNEALFSRRMRIHLKSS